MVTAAESSSVRLEPNPTSMIARRGNSFDQPIADAKLFKK